MENQFDRYVNDALQLISLGQQEDREGKVLLIVKNLHQHHANEFIDDDLTITIKELDIQLLEEIVRLYCDIRFFIDPQFNTIKIMYITNEANEFVDWFIRFFYYLEAIDLAETFPNHSCYNITDDIREIFECKFVAFPVNVTDRKFAFNDIEVEII